MNARGKRYFSFLHDGSAQAAHTSVSVDTSYVKETRREKKSEAHLVIIVCFEVNVHQCERVLVEESE